MKSQNKVAKARQLLDSFDSKKKEFSGIDSLSEALEILSDILLSNENGPEKIVANNLIQTYRLSVGRDIQRTLANKGDFTPNQLYFYKIVIEEFLERDFDDDQRLLRYKEELKAVYESKGISDNEITPEQAIEEPEPLEISELKRKVYTDQGDPEIDSLYRKWKDGDLNIQPDFQRGFVWDPIKASRLVESVLLDIPLPVIYLSQEKDGKEYVIDGQQRLTSLFSNIDGKLPDPQLPYGKDFKLTSLNVFTELNGSYFKDISKELQKKIRYYKIRTITFSKESEQELKFEVFERLNTGSVSLNDQELRNCIYRGKYNDLLWELSEDKTFRLLLGIKKPEKRMRDVELVLRFAAFYHAPSVSI